MTTDTESRASFAERYYNGVNARRLHDTPTVFEDDGQIEFSPGTPWVGPAGYLEFADRSHTFRAISHLPNPHAAGFAATVGDVFRKSSTRASTSRDWVAHMS